ncbi:MAG: hypothetical protein V8S72_07945 [Oscillospiraceae bacterium]
MRRNFSAEWISIRIASAQLFPARRADAAAVRQQRGVSRVEAGAGVGSAAFGTIEALCSIATAYSSSNGAPFMTADSFADIFYYCHLRHGEEFTGIAEQDIRSEEYKSL